MAASIEDYFPTTLGGAVEADTLISQTRYQEQVLAHVEDRLTEEEKLCLNAPITLSELEEEVKAMKKHNLCPGLDGAPVKRFEQLWSTIGPLLLQVLNQGIQRERFQPEFTLGLIVLLPKKDEQRFLNNKQPITLLNVIYKIGAKVLQRRLTPILQQIIAPQQFAFLSGRNIHHSLVLLGAMLHQAASSGEDHVLLKLDVIKAFDQLTREKRNVRHPHKLLTS